MSIFRNTQTNLSKVDRLLYLVNSSYFFGIGKDTQWTSAWGTSVTEENPPFPQSNITTVPEIKFYKKPYFQTLATDSQCGDIEFESCGQSLSGKKVTLINLESTSRETLDLINPDYLYFRVLIENSDYIFANFTSFRALGLFKDITFNTQNQIRYLPSNLVNSGKLYWASYFTALTMDSSTNKTSTFEILLKL